MAYITPLFVYLVSTGFTTHLSDPETAHKQMMTGAALASLAFAGVIMAGAIKVEDFANKKTESKHKDMLLKITPYVYWTMAAGSVILAFWILIHF